MTTPDLRRRGAAPVRLGWWLATGRAGTVRPLAGPERGDEPCRSSSSRSRRAGPRGCSCWPACSRSLRWSRWRCPPRSGSTTSRIAGSTTLRRDRAATVGRPRHRPGRHPDASPGTARISARWALTAAIPFIPGLGAAGPIRRPPTRRCRRQRPLARDRPNTPSSAPRRPSRSLPPDRERHPAAPVVPPRDPRPAGSRSGRWPGWRPAPSSSATSSSPPRRRNAPGSPRTSMTTRSRS